MLDHLRLPDGTNVVTLPAVARIADSVRLATTYGQSVVVHGPLGTGKYTATKMALQAQHLPVVDLDLEPGMSSKAVVRRLHLALVGHDDISERDLQDDVIHALTQQPPVVVVRHADRLSREASAQLNWLHQHPAVRCPLVLVGGPGVDRALQAERHLAGSVVQTVEVTQLKDQTLLDVLQSLHLLLAGAGAELLSQIDKVVCHGVLRNWITFLSVALHLREQIIAKGAPAPVLGPDLAKAVIHAMPTTLTKLGKP